MATVVGTSGKQAYCRYSDLDLKSNLEPSPENDQTGQTL